MLCAAARLGIADALGDEVRSVDHPAETCQTDVDAQYRLLHALASIGITAGSTTMVRNGSPICISCSLRFSSLEPAWDLD